MVADAQKIAWNWDGKEGDDDPNNSDNLQIKWLTSEGNYSRFHSGKITKKNESSHQRHYGQHNDGKVMYLASLLGLPVELSNGIAVQTKHLGVPTIKLTYTSNLLVSKLAVWVPCTGNRA